MNAIVSHARDHDFAVADLSLADFGRKEIQIAEHEMPGLMATRRKYAAYGVHLANKLNILYQQDGNGRLTSVRILTAASGRLG